MFRRTRAVTDPVSFELDGSTVTGERGEPIAVAILASGERRIARSPKLHRARGPACLRGDCDGCLARVNHEPNVMTCLRPLEGGEVVSTQNVLGTKDVDLLRITDWFFPKGIDHHHLLAGVPGVSAVMQSFARRMAGIGRLPKTSVAARPALKRTCDALVVGGGRAGVAALAALSARGLDALLVDDAVPTGSASDREIRGAVVAGIYDGEALVAAPEGATLVRPRAFVLATGAHDGVLLVPNNDLPGVMSARALLRLVERGIEPKKKVALVGGDRFVRALQRKLGDAIAVHVEVDAVDAIGGSSKVKRIDLKDGRSVDVDLVAVGTTPAPAFELGEALGAEIVLGEGGYQPVNSSAGGRIDSPPAEVPAWAIGSCTGAALSDRDLQARAEALATEVAAALDGAPPRRSIRQPSISVSNKPSPPATKTAAKRPSKSK